MDEAVDDVVQHEVQEVVTPGGLPLAEKSIGVLSQVKDILSPVQVEHEMYGTLQLCHPNLKRKEDEPKSMRTVCGKWRCGCPGKPTRYASFYDAFNSISLEAELFATLEFEPCGNCFHERSLDEHSWRVFIRLRRS